MGYLQMTPYVAFRTSGRRDVILRSLELSLAGRDGQQIRLTAQGKQIVSGGFTFMTPFQILSLKPEQTQVEQLWFSEPISEDVSNRLAGLEYEINRSIHQRIQEMRAASGTNKTSEATTTISTGAVGTLGGYTYTVYPGSPPNAAPFVAASEQTLSEVRKLFSANFKLRPGTYVATLSAYGDDNSLVTSKKYELTVLESQHSAIQENREVTTAPRYFSEFPPLREPSPPSRQLSIN